jgi:hypothetical protein
MAKRSAQSRKSGKSAGLSYLEPHTHNQYDTQRRVLDALSEKRRNPKLSLSASAKRMGTTVKTIRSYAGPALEIRSGRIDVKAVDRIARTLQILTASGLESVTVRNSRDATRVSRHHHAVRHALLTFGTDTQALERFAGKTLRAGGKTYSFVTDYKTLVRIARAGEVYFLDIYGPESSV